MAVADLAEAPAETTVDAFLDGRIEAVQPARSYHRSGLEAVLLGAAFDAGFDGVVADLGSGSGVAGMVAAARCAGARVLLVERDAAAIACARSALKRPANSGFAGRIAIAEADIAAPEAKRHTAGLIRESVDAVIANPPFHMLATTTPPAGGRAAAHLLDAGGLEPWIRAATSVLKPAGALVIVFRADRLAMLLAALDGRFGAVDILPVHPRAGEPAHRVLLRAIKGSRSPSRLLPPLVLHGETGNAFLPQVERILRQGAGIADVHPSWGA
jgi:tRNA1(Val) A37 N6-methylase TrmN6